jgi:competence protein ComEC
MYWSIRRRRGWAPRPDAQGVHAAAQALLALALLGAGFGVSRLAGAVLPVPLLGAAERAAERWLPAAAASAPEVRAEFIAAPAGRSVLILSGGHAALIDGGPPAVGEAIVGDLRALGIDRVDAAVMTKASAGAALGLLPVLDALPVGRILDLVPGSACPAHQAVMDDARAHGVPIQSAARGTSLSVGPARLDVLWPPSDGGSPGTLPSGPGLVRLVDGSVRLLFAGNVEPKDLDALQRVGPDLAAQVLEVPAGGAAGSLGTGFLRSVSPRVAVIVPGAAAPDAQVLQRLGAERIVTVEAGLAADLRLQTDGRGMLLAFDPGLPGQSAADSTAPAAGGSAASGPCD